MAGEGPYGLNGNIDATWDAFAPRLGIAYQIRPKTVIRMGYGRSFDMGVFGSNFGHAVTQSLPVLIAQSINDDNFNFMANAPDTTSTQTPNVYPAFTLTEGPPAAVFPAVPANGQLPFGRPRRQRQYQDSADLPAVADFGCVECDRAAPTDEYHDGRRRVCRKQGNARIRRHGCYLQRESGVSGARYFVRQFVRRARIRQSRAGPFTTSTRRSIRACPFSVARSTCRITSAMTPAASSTPWKSNWTSGSRRASNSSHTTPTLTPNSMMAATNTFLLRALRTDRIAKSVTTFGL